MIRLLSFAVAIAFTGMAFAGPMVEISNQEALNNYLTKGQFNGIALVARDSQVLYKKSFGVRDFVSNTPLDVNDKFLIGSNTKQFVAASLLKLQEEGKLSVEDKISKFLPEYTTLANITIRDLLNHTSGLANYTETKEFDSMITYERKLSLDDIIKFIIPYPFDFEVKSKWNYSNTGYIIAGKILEIVSGKSWDQYIHDEFLVPLKMNDTGYEEFYENITDVQGNILVNGKFISMSEEEYKFNLTWALSAGAIYSTVDDLLKWTAIYNDSNLLSNTSKKDMQTPFLANYGLGLMINSTKLGTQVNHSGRVPGFVTELSFFKDLKLSVITLDNTDGKFFGVNYLLAEFFSAGKAAAVKTDSLLISEEKMKEYVGIYKLGKVDVNVFLKEGQLYLQPNDGQPAYTLIANDVDSFRLMPLYFGEEFIRNADGKVIGFKNYQEGNVSYAAKINNQ